MIETKYISNCTQHDIDEIKIAALYFDKIDIVNNILYQIKPVQDEQQNEDKNLAVITGITEFVKDEYLNHIKLLTDEGIAVISSGEGIREDKLWSSINEVTNRILSEELQIIFKETNVKKDKFGNKISSSISLSEEADLIHREFVGVLNIGKTMDLAFMIKYYSTLLSTLLFNISKGEQCLTSSNILNNFLKYYTVNNKTNDQYTELTQENINSNLIMDALKIAVPNISAFPLEEVLETREKANSELLEFRSELATFQFNLQENYSLSEIHFKSSEIVKHKLNPSLIDLKRKIEDLHLSLPRIVIENFKDPKSYLPLVGIMFGGIPAHIAALLSLGVISSTTIWDYLKNRRDIKRNGLYYLIKLDNKFGK